MISADAKYKTGVEEPDFSIVAVSRGNVVIVGKNKKFQVGDHGFSKVSVIPDIILVNSKPEEYQKQDDKDTKCNKQAVGKWCSGKVFYSLRDMETQGSSAIWGTTKLSMAMENVDGSEEIPTPLYLFVYRWWWR